MGIKKLQDHRKSKRVFLKEDQNVIGRFSNFNPLKSHKPNRTIVSDLSKTGMSFWTNLGSIPHLGDKIGVEFTVPGGEQIACFGRVARVEEVIVLNEGRQETMIKIGVKFEKLPAAYSKMLDEHVQKEVRSEKINEFHQGLTKVGISVVTNVQSITVGMKNWLIAILSIVSAYFILAESYRVAETHWWRKEAKEIYQHNFEEKMKAKFEEKQNDVFQKQNE